MKILFLHGWHSVPGGVKPSTWPARPRGHQPGPRRRRLRRGRPHRPGRVRPAPARRDRRLLPWRGRGDEPRLGLDPAGPALPGLEAVGHGQDGQAGHGDPALRGRRRDPDRRQPGTGAGQRPARVGPDRRGQRPPAGRPRAAGRRCWRRASGRREPGVHEARWATADDEPSLRASSPAGSRACPTSPRSSSGPTARTPLCGRVGQSVRFARRSPAGPGPHWLWRLLVPPRVAAPVAAGRRPGLVPPAP